MFLIKMKKLNFLQKICIFVIVSMLLLDAFFYCNPSFKFSYWSTFRSTTVAIAIIVGSYCK